MLMRYKILLAVFFLKLFIQPAEAQIHYEGSDERTVTIISYEDRDNNRAKYKDENAIKIGIFDVFYGHQSVYYERNINKFFSVQGSLGIAHRNFYEDLGVMIRENSESYYSDEFTDADISRLREYRNIRKVGIGYSIGVNPRIYTNGWGMEGFYIGPSFRYQVNNYKYIEGGMNEKESLKKMTIGIVLGGQSNNKPVCLDYGVGIGYKSVNQKRYLTDVSRYNANDSYTELPDGMYNFNLRGVNFEAYLHIGGFWGSTKKSED